MSVHSTGTGSAWNETLDVDQPHGLDYREFNDIRIGTRRRVGEEHASFADNTVGGIHKPGGSAVLGIDDDTANFNSANIDGTYRGHGIAWDGSVNLWCATATAGATTTGDWTLLKMHPDKQWDGQDITWQGEAQFDASVEFLDPVDMTGPLLVDGSCDFSDVGITGTLSVDASSDFSDAFVEGDISINGALKVDGVMEVDGTATEFGGTAGIGLFYDPTAYAGGETSTLGNGLIIKMGEEANIGAGATGDVSFGTAFPNALISATTSQVVSSALEPMIVLSKASTGFQIKNASGGAATNVPWIALGH